MREAKGSEALESRVVRVVRGVCSETVGGVINRGRSSNNA